MSLIRLLLKKHAYMGKKLNSQERYRLHHRAKVPTQPCAASEGDYSNISRCLWKGFQKAEVII
jgi:hypothetical protein